MMRVVDTADLPDRTVRLLRNTDGDLVLVEHRDEEELSRCTISDDATAHDAFESIAGRPVRATLRASQ